MVSKPDDGKHNLLSLLIESADDLDLSDASDGDQPSPSQLIVPGFEISKLFAIIEFGLRHAADSDPDSLLAGTDILTREQAVKAVNGSFVFEVIGKDKQVQHWFVDMRRSGKIELGKGPAKPKPDLTIRVSDKDMVALATGSANPQMMFLKGRIKIKGNVMQGLRVNTVLNKEISKMKSKL